MGHRYMNLPATRLLMTFTRDWPQLGTTLTSEEEIPTDLLDVESWGGGLEGWQTLKQGLVETRTSDGLQVDLQVAVSFSLGYIDPDGPQGHLAEDENDPDLL